MMRRQMKGAVHDGGRLLSEDRAQGTLEYALTVLAFLAMVVALAALVRAGGEGAFVRQAEESASHALDGWGLLDIALY